MRHGIITAALALTVLSTGQALADDFVADAGDIGGFVGVRAPVADEYSLWMDPRQLFSDATVSVEPAPLATEYALTADPGYTAYAHIDFDGFTVGGRFARWGETAFSDADQQSFGVAPPIV